MTDPAPDLRLALAGRYAIERELGQGGMATVWLAQDLRHDRRVAIKVLRPELAAVIGAERFLTEIRTTANLQHPHILPLFDSGEAGGQLFYVMPFVEGESLRDRLDREKQLPIPDAVRIAGEVASALDYAHRHGVIHRDIKPGNILLHDGRALVADFGIALAASRAGTRMTETGMSLGTPHYMSPEQAMGERDLDARSDVYALGAVLYEMLTGEPPFTGPTAQAIVAKVMTALPAPVTTLRRTVPPGVAAAVHQAIEKLPADRFASAAEFAAALAGGGATARMPGGAAARRSGPGWAAMVGLGALGVAGMSAAFLLGRGARTADGPAVYDAGLPDSAPMTFAASTAATAYGTPLRNLSASPSGEFAVYAAEHGDSTMLWYRSLRDATARPLPGTTGATAPRVSPDGSRMAYFVGGRVMVVPVTGGEARQLFEGQAGMSLEWIAADTLLAVHLDGDAAAWLDPRAGVIRTRSITRCAFASWMAEARLLLCNQSGQPITVDPETGDSHDIRFAGTGGDPGGPVRGTAFRVVNGRHLVYLSPEGDLRAAPYDPGSHRVGRPATLLRGVRREGVGEGQFDVTRDGALVFAPGVDAQVGRLVRLRRGGAPEPLPLAAGPYQRYDLSPDGRWLAAAVLGAEGQELRVYDLRDAQQLTWLRAEYVRHPLWSPSGDRLIAAVRDSARWSILFGTPSSGIAPDTVLRADSTSDPVDPVDFHAAAEVILQDWNRATVSRFDPTAPDAAPEVVLGGGARFASISPDGRHVAFQTVDGNRVVVTSYPRAGKRWQLASDGVEPLWLSSGEVLYRSGVSWYSVRIDPATGEPAGPATFWARDPRFSDTSGWSNRLSHDGGIIYLQGPEQTSTGYLRVIPHWGSAMAAAVDAANAD
jgi:serine/threonine-protein kinase